MYEIQESLTKEKYKKSNSVQVRTTLLSVGHQDLLDLLRRATTSFQTGTLYQLKPG